MSRTRIGDLATSYCSCAKRECSRFHFESAVGNKVFEDCLEFSINLLGNYLLLTDLGEDVRRLGLKHVHVHFFEFLDLGSLQLVEEASHSGIEHASLHLDGHGHELLLLEQLGQLLTSVEELLSGSIEIRAELGKGGDLTVLGELQLERTGETLHGLNLGSRSYS